MAMSLFHSSNLEKACTLMRFSSEFVSHQLHGQLFTWLALNENTSIFFLAEAQSDEETANRIVAALKEPGVVPATLPYTEEEWASQKGGSDNEV